MADPNWTPGTIWTGDCLEIMRGMNSETIDLIYLDPPFNSNANYAAPVGSQAAGAAFKDTWSLSDVDAEWINLIELRQPAVHRVLLAAMTNSDKSYLVYMAARLLEMPRIMKPTASIWLHCDPTMGHYLKLLMDAIFGRRNFRNEIVWCYTGPASPNQRQFSRKHDSLFWFAGEGQWTFNRDAVRIPHHPKTKANFKPGLQGSGFDQDDYVLSDGGKIPESWWSGFTPVGRIKRERVGYPTQKPLALLSRIIEASSNPGDMVLDPFCGCATTLVAADRLDRQWVGIDLSPKAAELVVERVEADQGLWRNISHRTDIPRRTDLGYLRPPNSAENKTALYGRQAGHCAGCNSHFELRHLEVDHIIAQARGGTDHIENLQLLCGHCNRIKGDRGMEYLATKLQLTQ